LEEPGVEARLVMLRAVSNGNSTIELGRPNPSTSIHGEVHRVYEHRQPAGVSSLASTGSRKRIPENSVLPTLEVSTTPGDWRMPPKTPGVLRD